MARPIVTPRPADEAAWKVETNNVKSLPEKGGGSRDESGGFKTSLGDLLKNLPKK